MNEKGLNKPFQMERNEPHLIRVNDLITISGEANGLKHRILSFIERPEGDYTAWIGPVALTPQDVDQFAALLEAGLPKPEKFKDCRPVEAIKLRKVLDS